MAFQLQRIPNNLLDLALQLQGDVDIKDNILSLISEGRTLSNSFICIMQNEGRNVLNNKNKLMTIQNPNKVDVQNLKESLRALQSRLQILRDSMFIMQGNIHIRIEQCRTRSNQHEQDIAHKDDEIKKIRSEQNNLEKRINDCEEDANWKEWRAYECEEKARKKRMEEEKHKEHGVIGSLFLAGAGIVAAPFSAGTSLALTGAAVGSLGCRLYLADECSKEAKRHRQNANKRRKEAENYRSTKRELENEIKTKEKEIDAIRQTNKRITDALLKLHAIVQHLLAAVGIIDAVITHVQNFATTLFETEQQGDSFKIIQSAFGRNPEKLEGRALVYLNKLKEQWKRVENDLENVREAPAVNN